VLVLYLNIGYLQVGVAQQPATARFSQGQQPYRFYDAKTLKTDPRLDVLALDSVGRLIGGGARGAVLYDGSAWQTIRLRNQGAVSAVAVAPDNQIFVGGYNELGRIRPVALQPAAGFNP
jgi:hypothetical protein